MIFARPGIGVGLATGPVVTSGLGLSAPVESKPGLRFWKFNRTERRKFKVERVLPNTPKSETAVALPGQREHLVPDTVVHRIPDRVVHEVPAPASKRKVNLQQVHSSLPAPKKKKMPTPKRIPPVDG